MSTYRGPSASDPSSLSSAALRGAVDLSALAERARAAQSSSRGATTAPAGPETARPGEAPAGEAAAGKPSFVVDVNDASFEQFMQLSGQVICLVGFYADQIPGSRETIDDLIPLVGAQGGRIALGRVRAEESPGVIQAFQLQTVPAAVALIKGQPVPIFQGTPPAAWDDLFAQLIQLGDQHGVTQSVPSGAPQPAEDAEPELSPEEQAALDAIGEENYAEAERIYREILASAPADAAAKQGLLNAQLLGRIHGVDPAQARERAASDADDLEAHLLVADLDLTNGYVEDAFTRLIRFVGFHAGEEREAARARLVELFDLVGPEHPAVPAGRRQLAAALF